MILFVVEQLIVDFFFIIYFRYKRGIVLENIYKVLN